MIIASPSRHSAAAALLLMAVLAASACGGGKSGFPSVVEVGGGGLTPVIATSELVLGENRFVLGVLDEDGRPIVDARVHLKFYFLDPGGPVLKSEAHAVSRVPARDAGIAEEIVHTHADGTKHVHINVGEQVGVYTAQVTFDRPGDWGVEITLEASKPKVKATLRPRFNVLERGSTPAIGSAAPRSRNLTLADVKDISEIDSAANPAPELHSSTIADAVAAGKPALVLFAVPGFCDSRLCGPEYEIMRKLYPHYRSRLEFIHVEFYRVPGSPERVPAEAVREWGLRSEPWFFVIDARGIVSAKFEGPTSLAELDEALRKVVPAAGAR